MITGVDLISDSLAIMLDGSGGGTPAVMDEKTITENGVYYPNDENPPLDGYNKVTVNVETYEEEYEEMKECCDEVLEVIQQYDPDYDPEDPEEPTIPEKVEEIIEEESGYTFPAGTPYPPIKPTLERPVPDPITDVDADVTLELGLVLNISGYPFVTKTTLEYSERATYGSIFRPAVRITSSHGITVWQCDTYWEMSSWVYKREILGVTGINQSGNVTVLLQHYATSDTSTSETSIPVGFANLYGYGTSGDTYKIKNQ